MRQRTALALLVLTAMAACNEAPTGPRSELRSEGASRNAAGEGGGMFGSGHKVATSTSTSIDSETESDSISSDGRGGGMFGSGH
jgi:hypothetical protein